MTLRLGALLGGLMIWSTSSPLADEAPLVSGGTAQGQLAPRQTRAHAIDTAPGDFVQGRLDGRSLRLVLLDSRGGSERVLARGEREGQEFMFVTGQSGPYALEVRAPEGGAYQLNISRIIPKAAQVKPTDEPESPTLRDIAGQLAQGGDTAAFWAEIARRGTPLVESSGVVPPVPGTQRLVTFLWRGAQDNVRLFGAPSGDHDELQRLGQTDIWYRSYRLPADTRISYRLAPDVPELDASAMVRRRAILATAQRDPLNPHFLPAKPMDRFDGDSILELPDAPAQPWNDQRPGIATGEVQIHRFSSPILGNDRDIHLYRPPAWVPGAKDNALLVLFDAEFYTGKIPAPTILDNLIAAGRLPPMAAIIIANPSNETRSAELPPNRAFARFLAEELMPWAKTQGIYAPAVRTVVAGASYGGLASSWAAYSHPEWFGNVLSQSGSYWWMPPGSGEEAEWLTRQFVTAPVKPIRFVLQAGLFETTRLQIGILEANRHLRDVLRAKGYDVQHREYASGHEHLSWRGGLADGLLALLGRPE